MPFSPENFDESVERIKALLLVHEIKASPGGYKLSFEVILWLALNFEDAYLPGDAQTMAAAIHTVLEKEKIRTEVDRWYTGEPMKQIPAPKLWQRARKLANKLLRDMGKLCA